jgi:hypothetical protein
LGEVQGHKRQKGEIFLLSKVAEEDGILATVPRVKAATDV